MEPDDAAAVLWNGEERVCDARFSMELHTSTMEVRGTRGPNVLCVNAILQVDRQDVPRVMALFRDRAANLKVTVGRRVGDVMALPSDHTGWQVKSARDTP